MANTSTNRIAAEAGVSVGTVYRYFSDRSVIVDELLRRLLDNQERRVMAAMAGPPRSSVRELVTSILEVTTEELAAEAPLVRALVEGVPFYDSGLPELELRIRLMVKMLVIQMLGPGDDHEYDVMTFVLVNTCYAAVMRTALLEDDSQDQREILMMTARLITPLAEAEIAARRAR
ncbi:TetR/AcrR family transcriptional regulator [Nocardia wallacei]|uniref:TetR/AcrR family transcriptional regulator n=1 Tax=Nocardia wallacei TaxID=480035 RepID=UPI002454A319|nr:TetR/AcrR family transcriptional regulator [Nocardia wallacei]